MPLLSSQLLFLSGQMDLFSNATQPRVLGVKGGVLGEKRKDGSLQSPSQLLDFFLLCASSVDLCSE